MEVIEQKSWFRRNWKWLVPTLGCSTIIVLIIIAVVGFFTFIKNPEPIDYGMDLASKNEQVINLLGEPLEKEGLPKGQFTFSTGSGGEIDFVVPIKGPKGNAFLHVKGYEKDDEWVYEELFVEIPDGGINIPLIEE